MSGSPTTPRPTPYLQFARERGLGTIDIDAIEVVDLGSGMALAGDALAALRPPSALMPLCRLKRENGQSGYYKRFRADGSAVPWQLDKVNDQRREDGLEPISYESVDV